jgi:hypothetical protein
LPSPWLLGHLYRHTQDDVSSLWWCPTPSFTATDIRDRRPAAHFRRHRADLTCRSSGDTVDQAKAGEAIRSYGTGFFEDVSVDRQGSILVITVVERLAINNKLDPDITRRHRRPRT